MLSNNLILCHPFSSCTQSFAASGSFQMSALHIRWPKYWSFSFSIGPSNEYSGLISFRMDWLDLHAVQGTLKSLLQHRSVKASALSCSASLGVQLSHRYMTTGKTIALAPQTFVGKGMSLLFKMLSNFVIPFLPSASFQMSALHIRWPKYWSFSFNISPSNEHPGLISFRMDYLDPIQS